jgi:hypothetical protein
VIHLAGRAGNSSYLPAVKHGLEHMLARAEQLAAIEEPSSMPSAATAV